MSECPIVLSFANIKRNFSHGIRIYIDVIPKRFDGFGENLSTLNSIHSKRGDHDPSFTLNTDKSFVLKIAEGSHAGACEPSKH